MIAVLVEESEHPVVREFFELFKTPWEFYRPGHEYDILLCAGNRLPENHAKLVLVYGSEARPFDREKEIHVTAQRSNAVLLSDRYGPVPVYGKYITFKTAGQSLLADEATQEPAAVKIGSGSGTVIRVGYDLFREIRHLLTRGQPVACAMLPTLELHISMMRDFITGCSLPLVEIPPAPAGYAFTACLTHDVDHVGVRNHRFDHTMLGFLYRATVGSVVELFRGRKSISQLAKNWRAALSLPFVHLGFVKDFWYQFSHYLKIEKGLVSTFFFIPKKGDPGQKTDGTHSPKRAAKYDVAELTGELRELQSAGCEIGVHGIDAWRDSDKGRDEFKRIAGLTGRSELGVRMHWLYFDEQSPATLEAAGFSYDSTVGYNETIGYRAGTTQVFKPLTTTRLLELPMHVMDTAMFYPSYLNLSPNDAKAQVNGLARNAARFGGVLTINWHDRSIAPERLWDETYIGLLDDLKKQGAWFSTAAQSVSWFRARRSVVFEDVTRDAEAVQVKISMKSDAAGLPGLRVRVHKLAGFTETIINRSGEVRLAS